MNRIFSPAFTPFQLSCCEFSLIKPSSLFSRRPPTLPLSLKLSFTETLFFCLVCWLVSSGSCNPWISDPKNKEMGALFLLEAFVASCLMTKRSWLIMAIITEICVWAEWGNWLTGMVMLGKDWSGLGKRSLFLLICGCYQPGESMINYEGISCLDTL